MSKAQDDLRFNTDF